MKVTVAGGGVTGLSTAARLREAGHDVSVVSRDFLLGTASSVATAIWHLFWVEVDARVERWAAATLEELIRLAEEPTAGITLVRGKECVRVGTAEAAELSAGTDTASWKKVVPSYRPLSREELIETLPLDYPTETLAGGYEIEVPIADMSLYLPYLMKRLEASEVDLRVDTAESLEALRLRHPCDILVNCTGLGARELAGDSQVYGVKGQIVRVAGVSLDSYIADDNSPRGMTYVLPRRDDIILGGTQEEGNEDPTVDPKVGDEIIARCIALVPDLANAIVLEHLAGVRPCRSSIRLEAETLDHGTVIHNYGHGGSGVSLSWGCADAVAQLLSYLEDAA